MWVAAKSISALFIGELRYVGLGASERPGDASLGVVANGFAYGPCELLPLSGFSSLVDFVFDLCV